MLILTGRIMGISLAVALSDFVALWLEWF